jgi:hypothetical protein
MVSQNGQAAVAAAIANVTDYLAYPTSPVQKDPRSLNWGAPIELLLTTPYSYVPPAEESPSDSAVTPAWREATWHISLGLAFSNDASASTIKSAFEAATWAGNILRAVAPNSGAYQNEADVYEPDPIGSYWGQEKYARLQSIKKAMDPKNILTCWDCVGWNPKDARYACYPVVPGLERTSS